ncbi:hypothetical protein Hdeb2414_s0020g00563181 [Helianthus debilis subsp. tardiflorus]
MVRRSMIIYGVVLVEGIVKNLTMTGDHNKITAVINLLTHEYTYSPQANLRKI